MKRVLLAGLLFCLPLGLVAAGPQQDGPPDIDFQFKVDKAIKKGIEYLKGKRIGKHHRIPGGNELILLTYLHAGVPDTDPDFKELLKEGLESKLEWTYKVSLHAMCLEEYQRVLYQPRIYQCAQFLVDNISKKGCTRYGQPTKHPKEIPPIPTTAPRKDTATSAQGGLFKRSAPKPDENKLSDIYHGTRKKPRVVRKLPVKQQREGPGDHDHSNMQYSALGLRACHDAGIVFEPKLIEAVAQWWRDAQVENKDAKLEPLVVDSPQKGPKRPSGMDLARGSKVGSTQATRATTCMAKPEGWMYQKTHKDGVRGSMTAGAIGALCICDYILGKDWRKDKDVLEGIQWMAKNFTVTENPGLGSKWHYYYLYGIERAGMLFGTERFNDHYWYRTGAEYLLAQQGGDGKWNDVVDTCFAILFLKRATRHLVDVATGSSRR